MFGRIQRSDMSRGVIEQPSFFPRSRSNRILVGGLAAVALLSLGLWCYLSAMSLSAARQMYVTVTPFVRPEAAKPSLSPATVSTTEVQSRTTVVDDTASTELEVNGQEIAVPANGSVYKIIQNSHNNGIVDISVDAHSSGSSDTSSSTEVQIHTNSRSDTQFYATDEVQ